MIATIDSFVEASVFLWLDNLLVEKGQGFTNYSGNLSATTGISTPFQGWNVYTSPQRQWVYDSSISGAHVPTTINIGGNPTPPSSGLQFNYNEGSVYASTRISQPISAAYAYKDVNLYFTNQTAEYVLFQKKFTINPRSSNTYSSLTNEQVYPCIFIKPSAGANKIVTMDKLISTVIPIRLMFLADNQYLYRNVNAIIRDKTELFIPIFRPNELPFNIFGNLTSGSFDYSQASQLIQDGNDRLGFIKDISFSDFDSKVNTLIGPNIFGCMIDIDLEILRFPFYP